MSTRHWNILKPLSFIVVGLYVLGELILGIFRPELVFTEHPGVMLFRGILVGFIWFVMIPTVFRWTREYLREDEDESQMSLMARDMSPR